MAWTPAQRQANSEFKRNLQRAIRHVKRGGNPYSWNKSKPKAVHRRNSVVDLLRNTNKNQQQSSVANQFINSLLGDVKKNKISTPSKNVVQVGNKRFSVPVSQHKQFIGSLRGHNVSRHISAPSKRRINNLSKIGINAYSDKSVLGGVKFSASKPKTKKVNLSARKSFINNVLRQGKYSASRISNNMMNSISNTRRANVNRNIAALNFSIKSMQEGIGAMDRRMNELKYQRQPKSVIMNLLKIRQDFVNKKKQDIINKLMRNFGVNAEYAAKQMELLGLGTVKGLMEIDKSAFQLTKGGVKLESKITKVGRDIARHPINSLIKAKDFSKLLYKYSRKEINNTVATANKIKSFIMKNPKLAKQIGKNLAKSIYLQDKSVVVGTAEMFRHPVRASIKLKNDIKNTKVGKEIVDWNRVLQINPGIGLAQVGKQVVIVVLSDGVFRVAGKFGGELSDSLEPVFNKLAGSNRLSRVERESIEKEINRLQKMRDGHLNSAYMKAKNAQLSDKAYGTVKIISASKNTKKDIVSGLMKEVRGKGITKSELLSGSLYEQKFRVPSSIDSIEESIRAKKAMLSGAKFKPRKLKSYYEFKRYGIMISHKGKDGVNRAIAVEFNKVGNKISNIGFKTAINFDKYGLVSVYKKAKNVAGLPVRTKLRNIFVLKNSLVAKTPEYRGVTASLNHLEMKKVFFGDDRLNRREILELKQAIVRDLKTGDKSNVGDALKKLFKKHPQSSRSGYANSVRIDFKKFAVSKIKVGERKIPLDVVRPSDSSVELSFSKLRIPSYKEVKVYPSKHIHLSSKTIKRYVKKDIDSEIKNINEKFLKIKSDIRPTSSEKNIMMKKLSKIRSEKKLKQVERDISAIQTIIKPRSRVFSMVSNADRDLSVLSKSIRSVLPYVALKTATRLKGILFLLKSSNDIAKRLKSETSQNNKTEQRKKTAQAQRALNLLSSSLVTGSGIPNIQAPVIARQRQTKKPDEPTPRIKIKTKRKVKMIPRKKQLNTGYIAATTRRRINNVPLSKSRALDLLSFYIVNKNIRVGRLTKTQTKISVMKLNRKPNVVPLNFFMKNKNKFRIISNRGNDKLEIINKNYRR